MGDVRRPVALLVLVLLVGACGGDATAPAAGDVPPLHPSVDGYPETTVTLSPPGSGEPVTLAAKVAATPEHRQHGLMEVEQLPPGTGMLFLFPEPRHGGFWMFQTLVPLDIAYVEADGRIGSILAMEPCPSPPAGTTCPSYTPEHPYTIALEVPQGWFADQGVVPGWSVSAPTDRTDVR